MSDPIENMSDTNYLSLSLSFEDMSNTIYQSLAEEGGPEFENLNMKDVDDAPKESCTRNDVLQIMLYVLFIAVMVGGMFLLSSSGGNTISQPVAKTSLRAITG
jgi:hypothetical protein